MKYTNIINVSDHILKLLNECSPINSLNAAECVDYEDFKFNDLIKIIILYRNIESIRDVNQIDLFMLSVHRSQAHPWQVIQIKNIFIHLYKIGLKLEAPIIVYLNIHMNMTNF